MIYVPVYASVLIVVAVVAVVMAAVISLRVLANLRSVRKDAQPNPQIAAWAQSIGWAYQPETPDLVHRWSGPPFVGRSLLNHGVKAVQVVDGTTPSGHSFCSFTFRYSTEGRGLVNAHYWITALQLPAPLPALSVTPKRLPGKITDAMGRCHVNIGYPPFDNAYHVVSDEPSFASAFLQPNLVKWLLDSNRPDVLGIAIRIVGADLLCWQYDRAPYATPDFVNRVTAIDNMATSLLSIR